VDLAYQKLLIKPLSEDGRALLVKSELCGVKTWELNKAVDVSSAERGGLCNFRKIPGVNYNTALVEQDHLFLASSGILEAGTEEEAKRPTKVIREAPFQHSKYESLD